MPKRSGLRARLTDPTHLVFIAIIVLVVAWIGSGMLGREPPAPAEPSATRLASVAASWSEAEPITRRIVLYGDVQPTQIAMLRARTDGIVEEVVETGTEVAAGDSVGQLSVDDREVRLARAQAQVAAAQREHQATQRLVERNHATQSEAQARLAELEAARAELRGIELEIENTSLRAPAGGVINRVFAERGTYVSLGGEVLEVIDNDPLVAVVYVHQNAVARIQTGMLAEVHFIGAEMREGRVRFVAPIADADTRTFRVEVEVDNHDPPLPSGLSAEVVIPTDSVEAHRISAAQVRLDAEGQIGLHIVDEDDRIVFAPIEVVNARADGIWVTGLPERARVVTISQGTLAPGQRVDVRETPPEYLSDAREEVR
ncbi:efflux RND transporter periplasmic adaptor subunit [Halomonas daqingensis]|uniref:Efflux RND transporter periplasmic adaptor subunit n=1 Tax=Billgrantia desiderata TaxID=52021 RepID=A0ABS9B796_9GAMM|nr:efflux RND transporter periplasmic adaptor subunit [Halomonas desiderata]MCE8043120.1 efflux RND transporter periplasmic adaptor subunit [Halomonas desiderata]MCE8047783.1 efflux RND transporter periplasmic adaptor subunit [Halomonas desiderata]